MERIRTIIINNKSYVIPIHKSFIEFQKYIHSKFHNVLKPEYKITYKNNDNDVIVISSEEDYKIYIMDKSNPLLSITEANNLSEGNDKFLEASSILYSKYKSDNPDKNCFKCNGAKVNNKGKPCKICNGTGALNEFAWSLKKNIEKSIRREIQNMIQEEVRKSIPSQSISSNPASLALFYANDQIGPSYCSVCSKEIKTIEKLFKCMIGSNFNICEVCEDTHPHMLIKIRGNTNLKDMGNVKQPANIELMAEIVIDSDIIQQESEITKIWTVKNTGKFKWPKDIKLTQTGGQKIKVEVSKIDELNPNEQCEIIMSMIQSGSNYKLVFQLEADGKNFGPDFVIEIAASEAQKEEYRLRKIRTRVNIFQKKTRFDEKYKDNIIKILSLRNEDIFKIINMLTKNNNNLEDAMKKFAKFDEKDEFNYAH